MEFYHAQINDSGICVSITQNGAPINDPHFIRLDSFRADLLGMKWNGSAWVTP